MEKRSDNILQKEISIIIEAALKNRVFSACSVGYFNVNQQRIEGDILSYGFAQEGRTIYPVDERTVFDLASLTKPLVTAVCICALVDEKKLRFEDKLHTFIQTSRQSHQKITVLNLLTHSSGLPAHRPYYKKLVDIPHEERMDILVDWILAENLIFKPGTDTLYSDLGFMLLGKIIEKVSGESLDKYWQRRIILPLDLDRGLYFAQKQKKGSRVYVSTGKCGWSNTKLYGIVNDDNCRALGGVAGHAGLFGTAQAVLALCENIYLSIKGGKGNSWYGSDCLRDILNNKQGSWAMGFDTPTAGVSSSGKYFSSLSIGHLGFTGTSFWIDIQRGISIVLLTNRVLCGENLGPIKKLRPLLHDAIMKKLIKKTG